MKKRVAIYLSGVNDIAGGGGAERFFADLFEKYSNFVSAQFDLYFFCDQSTYNALRNVNKLRQNKSKIVLLWNVSNRYKKHTENLNFLYQIKKHKIDLLHCANFGRHDFNRLDSLNYVPSVKKILNIVDCQIPHVLNDEKDERYKAYYERYIELPEKIKFDGVYTWYKLFISYIKKNKSYFWNPNMANITSRFADIKKFKPSIDKKNTIVFASRMHFQKRPDWFLQAILILKNENKLLLKNWQFYFIGSGEMTREMEEFISMNNLSDMVITKEEGDLSVIYPTTSCYVSTQDYENFPSLSMMEAMACGNAVIARAVGQTSLMVKDGVNGMLLKEDSPKGLAMAIKDYISLTNLQQEQMQKESLRLIKEVHTPEAFIHQIDNFWENVINEQTINKMREK